MIKIQSLKNNISISYCPLLYSKLLYKNKEWTRLIGHVVSCCLYQKMSHYVNFKLIRYSEFNDLYESKFLDEIYIYAYKINHVSITFEVTKICSTNPAAGMEL